jgi:fatty-acyl-CoA synthase
MEDASRLSYSNGPSAGPLIGETIGANLERTTAAFGGREALVDVPSGRRWTYAELNADVDALAGNLIAAGVRAGDRVGIWAPNCPEWVLLQYASAKIGAILVNINPAYRSHELAYALRQSGVSVLVSAGRFKTSDYRAMIDEARGDLAGLKRVVYLGSDEWAVLTAGGDGDTAGAAGIVARRRAELDRRAEGLSFDDPINIQYTSGCRSTTRSTSSTRAVRPAFPRARRCPTTAS